MNPQGIEKMVRDAKKRANYDRTELYPISIAARIAFLHPGSIRKWIREGRIPVYGWRGAYRIRLTDLLPEIEREDGK